MKPSFPRWALAYLSSAALAALVAVAGCSSDDSSDAASSGQGESCQRTADCKSGLACIDNRCVPTAVPAGDGGAIVVPSESGAPPASTGAASAAEAGVPEAAPPPRLGALGESCLVTSDCASTLVCVPAASGVGGTCDLASYGLKATGKTCSGECATPADCCELPTGGVAGMANIKTCQDVLALLLTDNTTQCATAQAGSPVALGCFAYTTYCSTCANNNVWSCTDSQCVYNPSCQNDGPTVGGCPAQSRTGRTLPQFCDRMTNKCFNNVKGSCATGADCDGKPAEDAAGTCRGGNCTCYQTLCYFSCASNLDCPQGYGCDTGTKLCTQNGVCGSDTQCASQTGVVNAKCVSGACKLPCASDHDCGPSGTVASGASSFSGQVCGTDGYCQELGCTSDADCREFSQNMNPGSSTLNFFCATPVAPPPPPPVSAITN